MGEWNNGILEGWKDGMMGGGGLIKRFFHISLHFVFAQGATVTITLEKHIRDKSGHLWYSKTHHQFHECTRMRKPNFFPFR